MTGFQFLAGTENSSLCHHIQTGGVAHTTSYPVGTGGSFPGGRVTLVWSSPPSSM